MDKGGRKVNEGQEIKKKIGRKKKERENKKKL